VIVHLIAQSKEHTLPEAVCDALRRIEGAFSLVMMTRDRVFAIRDPRGFRRFPWDVFPTAALSATQLCLLLKPALLT